jgi:hypothetical protein
VLDTVKTKRVRFDHNIHTASELKIMTSRKPRVVILLAMLATLISEELVAHRCNIVMTIAVSSVAAESAENLELISIENGDDIRDAYVTKSFECAFGAMRAGFRVEAEWAEGAEILELRKTFAVEVIKSILSGWCLYGDHDEQLWLMV